MRLSSTQTARISDLSHFLGVPDDLAEEPLILLTHTDHAWFALSRSAPRNAAKNARSIVKLLPAVDVLLVPTSGGLASMIAMVSEERLQQLAHECLDISKRTEDARTASEMLRLSNRVLQLATPTIPTAKREIVV